MNKQTVVVVDDNQHNLTLEKDLLEIAGFEVFIAENGKNGIALINQIMPDFIIMDIRLPDISGTEAIRILREDERTSHIPVIFVTASVMTQEVEKIGIIPNSFFMSKPINTRTFTLEINKFISKTPALPTTLSLMDEPCKTAL